MIQTLHDWAMTLLLNLLLGACSLLGLERASAMMSWLARRIGPRLSVQKIARRNLQAAFPEWDTAQLETVLDGMWDNLGRVAGELPFIRSAQLSERVTLHGGEHLAAVMASGKPAVFITAHLGNWELASKGLAEAGLPLVLVYRPANNPGAEKAIRKFRKGLHAGLYPKGEQGLRKVVKAMREGKSIGLLVDQKYNQGIPVPFFGREAMTSPAVVKLARKFDAPIYPVQVVRKAGVQFDLIIHPPLNLLPLADAEADTRAALYIINHVYETWIRQHPEQWFWVHQRWPK